MDIQDRDITYSANLAMGPKPTASSVLGYCITQQQTLLDRSCREQSGWHCPCTPASKECLASRMQLSLASVCPPLLWSTDGSAWKQATFYWQARFGSSLTSQQCCTFSLQQVPLQETIVAGTCRTGSGIPRLFLQFPSKSSKKRQGSAKSKSQIVSRGDACQGLRVGPAKPQSKVHYISCNRQALVLAVGALQQQSCQRGTLSR